LPLQPLSVAPFAFVVVFTEPLLFCETLLVLELLADALPLDTVAEDLPVFEPELVLLADPPWLPAWVSVWSPSLPTLPPLAPLDALCELSLEPDTPDFAELKPEFASAIWCVSIEECWSTLRLPELSMLPPPLRVAPVASTLLVTPPPLFCETLLVEPFDALADPELADAFDVPSLLPEFLLVAGPPLLPLWVSVLSPLFQTLPSLAVPSAVWVFSFSPLTCESALLNPLFATDACHVSMLLF
jgi:hypothetical protein